MFRKAISVMKVSMVLTVMTLALGCSGGGGTASTGTLKLSITDKASDDFKNVVISIREIRVVPAGRENASDDDSSLPVVAHFATPKS